MESIPNKEQLGHKVKTYLKFIRHGERTKTGELTDYGRQVTRNVSKPNEVEGDWLDETEVIGSNADPKDDGYGRGLETANIYGLETDGSAMAPKPEDRLNYKCIKTPMPYDHTAIYNSFLPANFDALDDIEKAEAARLAQEGVMQYLVNLNTEEGINYKKETAGAFANLILEYQRKNHELPSRYTKRVIAGTHGGSMEFVLQQALVHYEDGEKKIGFDDFKTIGGIFHPSENYDVVIETDEDGKDKVIKVVFDDPKRPQRVFTLDPAKVKELSEFYEDLHK